MILAAETSTTIGIESAMLVGLIVILLLLTGGRRKK
jgi:hypothetical protein